MRRNVARLTVLGDPVLVRARADELGIDFDGIDIINPLDSELVDEFADAYHQLHAHRGIDEEAARDIVRDVSYFGTMMVHLGKADGMVSGAAHTTAHTIRPSFEIIKTKPGVSTVSSAFFWRAWPTRFSRSVTARWCLIPPTDNSPTSPSVVGDCGGVRHHAAGGDAVVFDRSVRVGCRRRQSAGGHRAGTRTTPGSVGGGPIQYDAAWSNRLWRPPRCPTRRLPGRRRC